MEFDLGAVRITTGDVKPRVQHHHEFYIVNDKNERIATATIYFKRGGLWLSDIWTHAERRNKGLARHMIESVLALYGEQTIYLTVSPYWDAPISEDGLVAFYSSFGFERTDVPDVMVRHVK